MWLLGFGVCGYWGLVCVVIRVWCVWLMGLVFVLISVWFVWLLLGFGVFN